MKKNSLITCLILSLSLCLSALADKQTIVLLNSDSNVKFYHSSQESFLKEFKQKVTVINLGDSNWKSINKVKTTLYDLYPDVTYCIGTRAYLLASKFIPERKIVFSSTVNSHNLPKNKNSFGISTRLHPGMELMTWKMLFPEIKRIGVLYTNKFHAAWLNQASNDSQRLGIKLEKIKCDSVKGVTKAKINKLDKVDAVWLIPDPGAYPTFSHLKLLMTHCQQNNIPLLSYSPQLLPHKPVVASVSVDTATIGRQAAILVNDLLKGHKPQNKVFYPAGTVIKINHRRAKEMNIEIDPAAVSSVDELVE